MTADNTKYYVLPKVEICTCEVIVPSVTVLPLLATLLVYVAVPSLHSIPTVLACISLVVDSG